jgi:hypothetical protein
VLVTCGRIGEGAPFQVGTGVTLSVETAGRVYLGVNDETHTFEDNSGNWTVDITISDATEEKPPCLQATVTFSSPSGKAGDTITVQGKDWYPGGTVDLVTDEPIQFAASAVQVSDSGVWETSFTVPDTASPGDYQMAFREDHEGCQQTVVQTFTVKEKLSSQSAVKLNVTQGPAGTKVIATGTDWRAGDHIQVTWDNTAS